MAWVQVARSSLDSGMKVWWIRETASASAFAFASVVVVVVVVGVVVDVVVVVRQAVASEEVETHCCSEVAVKWLVIWIVIVGVLAEVGNEVEVEEVVLIERLH